MFARVFAACRLSSANIVLAILAMTVILIAPIATGTSDAASNGEVVCKTVNPGGPSPFGECNHKLATGGSVTFNVKNILDLSGGEVKFKWASGKITVAGLNVTQIHGGCAPLFDDLVIITGSIVSDTTGKITQPVDITLCDNETDGSVWSFPPGANAEF
jgi:hypothetical protein